MVTSSCLASCASPRQIEAQTRRQQAGLHASPRTQRQRHAQKLLLGAVAQEPVEVCEHLLLFLGVAAWSVEATPERGDVDAIQTANRLFQLHPPHARRAVGEAGGHIGGHGRAMALQHRQNMLDEVAVAVVEGEHDKGRAFVAASLQFRQGVVHGQNTITFLEQMFEQRVEKID